jgi:expansin
MQVVNANKRVASLDVSTDGGSTWKSTSRQSYNFFENSSGFGTSTVDVKVTSIDGDVVVVKDVEVTPDLLVTASANFGSSGTVTTSSVAVASSSLAPVPVESPSSTKLPISAPTTAAGANLVEVTPQSTLPAPAVVATSSYSVITPVPTPAPSEPEVIYVTIEACPA